MTDPRSELERVIAEMRAAVESTWDAIDDIDLQVGRWAVRLSAILQRSPQETKEPA